MDGISAILLAAGESTRMGRLKALLPWQGATLIEYQVGSLLSAGVAELVVVVGHRGDEVGAPIAGRQGVTTVVNPDYRQGKTTSIKAGLSAMSANATAILVLAVDQPRPPDIMRAVIEAHEARSPLITSPVYGGRGGHPMIFHARLLPELSAITEEGEGLREVTRRYASDIYRLEMDDPVVRVDVNTPENLQAALPLFEGRG